MKSPFDVAKDLMYKKTSWNEDISTAWNTFMVNRVLSMNQANIDFIDMVQRYYHIPEQNIHELYRSLLPKDARFYPYTKATGTLSKDIKLIAEHYCLSKRDARVYLHILSSNELESLRQQDSTDTIIKRHDNRKIKRAPQQPG